VKNVSRPAPPAPPTPLPAEAIRLLRSEAAELAALVGEAPEVDDRGFTPEAAAWHERYCMAADALELFAGGDAGVLRGAMGPVWDSLDPSTPVPSWRSLLAMAAIRVENRHGR